MTLSDADAQALLTTPTNLTAKAEALRWQNRVRFHGLTVRDKTASAHYPTFKAWVEGFVLVDDKRTLFDNIFPFPTPCTPLLAKAQDAFMKLFDGVNPHLLIEGADGVESDLLDYLDQSGESDFWPDEAIAALIESHEDILLIDIKPGAAGQAEPFIQRVPLDSVVSIGLTSDAECEHLIYKTETNQFVVVDDNSYRLYSRLENGSYRLEGAPYPHFLGRCPARKLWDERVSNHAIASASIVDEILSRLDAYAFWSVGYDMFKLYGAFPIYYAAEHSVEPAVVTPLLALNDDGTPDAGYPYACHPAPPAGNSFIGAGELFTVPPGGDMSVPPVGIVEPSTASLDFQSTDIDKQEAYLLGYLTGVDGESPLMKEAINEKQASAGFVDKQTKLLYLSRHLSAARQWAILTIGQLRYGNALTSVDFSFGTEFYLQTETELWEGLQIAKNAGSPRTILYEKIQGIEAYRLRTGGNPTRSQILLDLEPLVEATIPELTGLIQFGIVKPETVAVKQQFTDLIRLLERTYGSDITQIGSALPYNTRIERLKQFLYDNVSYQKPEPAEGVGRASGANA